MRYSQILPVLFFFIMFVIFCIRFKLSGRKKNEDRDKYEMNKIILELKEYMNSLLCTSERTKTYNGLNEKREHLREELRLALRQCNGGDIAAKNYVKEHIRNWLLNDYGITPENINNIIRFNDRRYLKTCDKFDIILRKLEKKFGIEAFTAVMEYIGQDTDIITDEDIDEIYSKLISNISFDDCVDVVVQRIYQHYKGHGVIDELRDMNIDGISGGVSGIVSAGGESYSLDSALKNFNSVWVFYKGKMRRLSFLGFGDESELERVCKNIYRYSNPGQLSAARGYIANEMKDGSRVIVVRPPFSESWAFFIRKFGMGMLRNINELVTGENAEIVTEFLKILVLSSQVFGFTGEQGCGKTTMLKAVIAYIPESYTIRVQELVYELHLRELYPKRNIVSFRETDTVGGREGLDIQKKTDGTVNIIGEVASSAVASWLVMAAQVASRFTIFTHHAKSTENLIYSLRNDLMLSGGFNNEKVAENQVKSAIRFDVHMVKDIDGQRYIERITQILPHGPEMCRDIIIRDKNGYRIENGVSRETYCEIYSRLNENERIIMKKYE